MDVHLCMYFRLLIHMREREGVYARVFVCAVACTPVHVCRCACMSVCIRHIRRASDFESQLLPAFSYTLNNILTTNFKRFIAV